MQQRSVQGRPRAVRRLSPEARDQQIVLAAIELITEQGLNFNTRELALRISVSHPLLFHYFTSKDDILDEVYQEVFAGRYSEELRSILNESASDQIEQWTRFYTLYFPRIQKETWIRIFIASAFSGGGLSRRHLRNIVTPLVDRLAADTEIHVFGLPVVDFRLPLDIPAFRAEGRSNSRARKDTRALCGRGSGP